VCACECVRVYACVCAIALEIRVFFFCILYVCLITPSHPSSTLAADILLCQSLVSLSPLPSRLFHFCYIRMNFCTYTHIIYIYVVRFPWRGRQRDWTGCDAGQNKCTRAWYEHISTPRTHSHTLAYTYIHIVFLTKSYYLLCIYVCIC
jgi:hypothetical protein